MLLLITWFLSVVERCVSNIELCSSPAVVPHISSIDKICLLFSWTCTKYLFLFRYFQILLLSFWLLLI